MGNGLVRRYRPDEEDIHNNWRKPKARPKRKPGRSQSSDQVKAVPEEASHTQWRQPKVKEVQGNAFLNGSNGTSTTASGNSNNAPNFMNWQMASAVRDTSPTSPGMMGMDDGDEDDADCANLADAAAKVWEDLMVKREATKDFGALFYLGELKDGVERAAKRVEVLRREVNVAATTVEEKERGLSELCSRIEDKLLPNTNTQWKLGDMAIRRGKGLCELSVVHHEAFPPYYEVRMVISGSVVGTEANNLLELPSQQKSLVRSSLKELEKARAKHSPLDESLTQAQEELKRQHQALTDQVEKKLRDNSAATTSPPQSGASPASLGPGPALGSAPPGLPDLSTVKRWGAGKAPGEASVPAATSPDYPDMRGSKEDTRAESPSTTPTGGPPGGGGLPGANTAPAPQSGPKVHSPTTPVGFPSIDELNRVEEQKAAERAKQQASATAASQYPGAHPGANREAFQRPEATQKGRASLHAGRPPASQTPDPGPVPRANTMAPESGIPAGFPRLDPTFANSQDHAPSSQQRHAQQPQQQQHAQNQQQQTAHQQQQQQQPHQQVPPTAAAAEWVVYRTAEGCPYYHNERTNETVWQLPMGARFREPGVASAAQSAEGMWQQEPQQQAEDDPFADLRKREEEMKQQREHWAQWYAQYCQWYSQQAQQQAAAGAAGGVPGGAGIPAGAPPPHGGQRHQAPPHFGTDPSGPGHNHHGQQQQQGQGPGHQGAKLPPKGPAPPTLDAGFEDQATYAIKSSVLKEMEAMVAKGAPLAQRKKALRCLHLRWHPDKNPDKLEVAKNVFQFIEETKPWFLHDPDGEETGVT